jgi:hypothetical protein
MGDGASSRDVGGVGGVGTVVWVDNLRSAFHGRRGKVVEITSRMVSVEVEMGGSKRPVWFLGGELRVDRFFAGRPKLQIREC